MIFEWPGRGRSKLHSRTELLFLLLGLLLMLGVQMRLMQGRTFWDDFNIFDNEVIRDSQNPWLFWYRGQIQTKAWPLFYTLAWAVYGLLGPSFLAFRLLNLALHGANGALLYLAARRMGMRLPAVPALVFWLHPLAVEPVSWIFQLSKILSATFLYAWWVQAAGRRPVRGWVGQAAAMLGAIFSGGFAYFVAVRELVFRGLGVASPAKRWALRSICFALVLYFLFVLLAGLRFNERRASDVAPIYAGMFPRSFGCAARLKAPAAPWPVFSANESQQSAAAYLVGGGSGRTLGLAETACLLSLRLATLGLAAHNYVGRFFLPLKEKIPQPVPAVNFIWFTWFLLTGTILLGFCIAAICGAFSTAFSAALLTFLPVSGFFFFGWMNYTLLGDRLVYVPLGFWTVFLWRRIEMEFVRRRTLQAIGICWLGFLLAASFQRAEYLQRVYAAPFLSIFHTPEP